MIRALWTGASGMKAQQFSIDTISNNLANVSTNGFKAETPEFKSLLYQTMSRSSEDVNGNVKPTNLQVGLGVKYVATSRNFEMGNLNETGASLDMALEGEGFLTVQVGGDEYYTRDASLKLGRYDGEYVLTTAEGYPVLNTDGDIIPIPMDAIVDQIIITQEGNIQYVDPQSNGTTTADLGMQFSIVQFQNKQGLEAVGSNLFKATDASGEPMAEIDGEVPTLTKIRQGYKEASNVQVANEMVNLIVAQRAYELNSKSIQTADSMLELANNLKR